MIESHVPDVVRGADPAVRGSVRAVTAHLAACEACAWQQTFVDSVEAMDALEHHREFAHPAHRNPDLTCQASPMWDHERWCLRAKGHDGDHWTPDGGTGRRWPS